jgi:hypothetical protein
MKVLITGGTGQIGRLLVKHLAQKGDEVLVLTRTPQQVRGLPEGARPIGWDGRTPAGWAHLAEGADALINLAGENLAGEKFLPARWTAARKQRILQSRLQAGQAVLAAVQQATLKPKVVIQASAVGYYGPQDDRPLSEEARAGEDFLAQTCVQWEDSTTAVAGLGVRRVAIRTGVVLTPEGGALYRMMLPFKLFAGGPFGNGKQWVSWIHPADEIAAIAFLIENPQAQGAFNLAAPQPVNSATFSKTLGRVMKRPSWLPVPGFAMKAALGEVSTVVLDGQRVLPTRLQALGFEFQFPELEPALRNLLT